ncbi:hypothetical protein TIFTF001_019985 [Ficus carica]|uniref:Uncharacterized protein n=1 Tax=Ficus carica TaxID=3494 RepID=A0AA88AHE5_FICCA|nr:hypothetical protein TIFTF001_019985 [Ficus carica]
MGSPNSPPPQSGLIEAMAEHGGEAFSGVGPPGGKEFCDPRP